MSDDPYRSPNSDVGGEPGYVRPLRGIIGGFFVDIGGTFVGATIMVAIYMAILTNSGKSLEQIEQIFQNSSPFSLFNVLSALWGMAMSFAGGFVCVRLSGARDYLYPLLLGIAVLMFGVLTSWSALRPAELIFWSALSLAATLYGAQRALVSGPFRKPE